MAKTSLTTMAKQYKNSAVLPSFIGHSLLLVVVLVVAVSLVYQYWHGEYGRYELDKLKAELHTQQQLNKAQIQTNERLRADVADLKSGLVAAEEHARLDLGLIKPNEIFVQLSASPETVGDLPQVGNEPDAVEVLEIMIETEQ